MGQCLPSRTVKYQKWQYLTHLTGGSTELTNHGETFGLNDRHQMRNGGFSTMFFFRDPDGTRKTRTPTHPCVQWPGSWSRVQSVFPKGPDTARCNLDMEISWRCRCKMGYDEDILSMSFSISLVYHLAPWKIGISPFILYIYIPFNDGDIPIKWCYPISMYING